MKYTIVRTSTVKSMRMDRIGRDDLLIIYVPEAGQSAYVTLPAEDISDEKIAAAIAANEATHGGYKGKVIEA